MTRALVSALLLVVILVASFGAGVAGIIADTSPDDDE